MWQFSAGLGAGLDVLPFTAQGGDWAAAAPIYITAGFSGTHASSLLVIWGCLSLSFLPSWMNLSRVTFMLTLVERELKYQCSSPMSG